MRIAWFSPLSRPHLLKSAAYTQAILPYLPSNWSVSFFVDDQEYHQLPRRENVFHFHRYYDVAEREVTKPPFDVHVYHFEDHPSCHYVRLCAAVTPGVCFFHDLRLNELYRSQYAHSSAAKDFDDLMDRHFGATSIRIGQYHLRGWPLKVFDRLYPCGREEFANAGVAMLESDYAMKYLAKQASTTTLRRSQPAVCQAAVDKAIELEKHAAVVKEKGPFVVTVFSQDLIADGVERILATLGSWQKTHKQIDLEVLLVQEVSDEFAFAETIAGSTLVLALQCDELRGLPQAALSAMRLGVPVVVSDLGASAEMPSGVAMKLAPGEEGSLALSIFLDTFFSDRYVDSQSFRSGLGKAGVEFITALADPKQLIADLQEVLINDGEQLVVLRDKREQGIKQARDTLLQECLRANKDQTKLFQRAVDDFSWSKA